ncbi:MAG: hypothetical protein GQ540_08410 [Lutibacter sp.]|uniref:hypothetical protein n=1 Tax=Lutibacter sp. TaxID=1925666 RepID=UPI0019DA5111|nr:hypothetical protein [Lutibacter sp.]NOR28536.1 hypothetical protein [Lutibacter sp.]
MKKIFLFFFLIYGVINAQNKAHKGWDLLDKPIKRAHWSWQNYALKSELEQDAYLDFCLNKSISDIYMFCIPSWKSKTLQKGEIASEENQEKIVNFIQKANNRGVKVWGLYYSFLKPLFKPNGKPDLRKSGRQKQSIDYMGKTSENEHVIAAKIIMDAVGKFNLKYPKSGFHGVQFDQEPRSKEYLVPYLEYCEAATKKVEEWNKKLLKNSARPFVHSAALRPSWVSRTKVTWNGSSNYVAYHYMSFSKHGALMNYTSNNDRFIKLASTLLKWADEFDDDKFVAIGVETDNIVGKWKTAKNETYYDEIAKENRRTRFNKFEADLDKAEQQFLKFKSYDRIAIHSAGYIEHWFKGKRDFKIIGRAPKNTLFSNLKNDASPNAIISNE